MAAETRTDILKSHPSTNCSSLPRAYMEIPEEKMVITANEKALYVRVFSS